MFALLRTIHVQWFWNNWEGIHMGKVLPMLYQPLPEGLLWSQHLFKNLIIHMQKLRGSDDHIRYCNYYYILHATYCILHNMLQVTYYVYVFTWCSYNKWNGMGWSQCSHGTVGTMKTLYLWHHMISHDIIPVLLALSHNSCKHRDM